MSQSLKPILEGHFLEVLHILSQLYTRDANYVWKNNLFIQCNTYTLKERTLHDIRQLMNELSGPHKYYSLSQCPCCDVSASQVEDEAVDLHHVRWFQVALQFVFLRPQKASVWSSCGAAVGQNGFEEEYLSSN